MERVENIDISNVDGCSLDNPATFIDGEKVACRSFYGLNGHKKQLFYGKGYLKTDLENGTVECRLNYQCSRHTNTKVEVVTGPLTKQT